MYAGIFVMNAHGFKRIQPFRISLLLREWDHEYYYDGGKKTNICSLKCVHLYFFKGKHAGEFFMKKKSSLYG